jgi:hypothetical protein
VGRVGVLVMMVMVVSHLRAVGGAATGVAVMVVVVVLAMRLARADGRRWRRFVVVAVNLHPEPFAFEQGQTPAACGAKQEGRGVSTWQARQSDAAPFEGSSHFVHLRSMCWAHMPRQRMSSSASSRQSRETWTALPRLSGSRNESTLSETSRGKSANGSSRMSSCVWAESIES